MRTFLIVLTLFTSACATGQRDTSAEASKEDNRNASGLVPGDSSFGKAEPGQETDLPVITGLYNDGLLYLALNGRLLSGYYANGRYQGNPNFGCSFYFYGYVDDQPGERSMKILTLNPFDLTAQARAGVLKLHGEEDGIFTIVADLNAEDCWDKDLGFTAISEAPGARFTLTTAAPWREIRLAADKLYFFETKADSTRRKAYVLAGDPLVISRIDGAWAEATYFGRKTTTTGWIKIAATQGLADIGDN